MSLFASRARARSFAVSLLTASATRSVARPFDVAFTEVFPAARGAAFFASRGTFLFAGAPAALGDPWEVRSLASGRAFFLRAFR